MGFADIFAQMGDLAVGAKARRRKENEEFLVLLRQIVETVPQEVVRAFGTLASVALYDRSGKEATAGIKLTVGDYLWWQKHLEAGNRFRWGVKPVKQYMLTHLAKQVEAGGLEPKERKALLKLIDEGMAE